MSCGSSGVRTSAAARSGQICKWTRIKEEGLGYLLGDVLRGQVDGADDLQVAAQ